MKTRLHLFLGSLGGALLLARAAMASPDSIRHAPPPDDRAAQLLARHGSIPLAAVGPYVEVGSYRMQVAAKLGEPDLKLTDGSWLYHHHQVRDSRAAGTVVVRFDPRGRVSSIAAVAPRAVALLRGDAEKSKARGPFASR